MESELVKAHSCLTSEKARPGPVIIINTPWTSGSGARHADLVAHSRDCKNVRRFV